MYGLERLLKYLVKNKKWKINVEECGAMGGTANNY